MARPGLRLRLQKPIPASFASSRARRAITGRASTGGRRQRSILDLQRSAGNAAVSDLVQLGRLGELQAIHVQRQILIDVAPLTDEQVAKATEFYARQPDRYTPEIISQIQTRVGAISSGVIDSSTIQAVARFQQGNPPLKVDGMAGPRTLPEAFVIGLEQAGEVAKFATGAKTVESQWTTLGTAAKRGEALVKEVNDRLKAVGVPPVAQVVKNIESAGQFDFVTWTMELGREDFAPNTITDADAAEVVDTVYHEARHAEQFFRMAQTLAGRKNIASAIAARMSIPIAIAKAAVANPIAKGSMEAVEADGWFDSIYGAGSEHREKVLADLNRKQHTFLAAQKALEKAQAADEKNHTPATEAAVEAADKRLTSAQEAFAKAVAAHDDLPEEFDATRVGNKAREAFSQAGP